MDKDYKNFVERMGSFEDTLDLTDNKEIFQSDKPKNIVTRNYSALVNSNTELKHFGTLGMHWGHHRPNTVNAKWTSNDGSSHTPFKMNADTVGKAAKTGQDLASLGRTVNKNGFNKKTVDESKHLSDDDLKKLTNRLNLENNYINAKYQQSGRSKVETILATTGSVLAVASSAAMLYGSVKK